MHKSSHTTTFLELWCEQRKQCWSKLGKGSILLFLDRKVGTGLVVFPEITPTFRALFQKINAGMLKLSV